MNSAQQRARFLAIERWLSAADDRTELSMAVMPVLEANIDGLERDLVTAYLADADHDPRCASCGLGPLAEWHREDEIGRVSWAHEYQR